ncbi:MAG: carbamoyl-phosphate synthase small subunit [Proteobacteria bacterium]|nr:carbamoyl-phosphate synthase small subunit [Pseudomonadota bacterium]
MSARLALSDGTVLRGRAFGARATRLGEAVFNTSLTGYQEILTDPSYAGQIIVMTAPQIGNTGWVPEDDESRAIFASGLVVREASPTVSSWRSRETLDARLTREDTPAIDDIDTRALTLRLRDEGCLRAVLSTEESLDDDALVTMARDWPGLDNADLTGEVTCAAPYAWTESSAPDWAPLDAAASQDPLRKVAVYDFGVKRNILRRLRALGCDLTVVPARTPAEEVLALEVDGIVLSNGPGDPAALDWAVETARTLMRAEVPLLGICLGHQILARALGARTYRLKFGHHGGNQPVRHLPSGRVEISAHNHNFAVDPETLPEDARPSHINLNDGCCEGFEHATLPLISIQYHPEAAPGPHDADPVFTRFVTSMHTVKVGN